MDFSIFGSFQDLHINVIILTEVHFKGLTCVTRCDSDNSCQVSCFSLYFSELFCIDSKQFSVDHDHSSVLTACQNPRKLCLCDGLCGLSCIRPEKECPELADPPSGQVGK